MRSHASVASNRALGGTSGCLAINGYELDEGLELDVAAARDFSVRSRALSVRRGGAALAQSLLVILGALNHRSRFLRSLSFRLGLDFRLGWRFRCLWGAVTPRIRASLRSCCSTAGVQEETLVTKTAGTIFLVPIALRVVYELALPTVGTTALQPLFASQSRIGSRTGLALRIDGGASKLTSAAFLAFAAFGAFASALASFLGVDGICPFARSSFFFWMKPLATVPLVTIAFAFPGAAD